MEPTLGDIKFYCESNNVKVDIPQKEDNSSGIAFKNPEMEAYFQYYIEHSVEIADWFNKKNNKGNELYDFSINKM